MVDTWWTPRVSVTEMAAVQLTRMGGPIAASEDGCVIQIRNHGKGTHAGASGGRAKVKVQGVMVPPPGFDGVGFISALWPEAGNTDSSVLAAKAFSYVA